MRQAANSKSRPNRPIDANRWDSVLRILKLAILIPALALQCIAAGDFRSAEAASPKAAPAPRAQNTVYEITQDKGYRFERGGWIYVHLEGSPHDIGYQHGYLLAPEIADAFGALRLEMTQDKGYRFDRGGWIYVHLEGSPHDIGYQHGYLLAPEISDAFATVRLEATHNSRRDWEFFRRAAREMLWPKIDPEYQAELRGIVDGLQANNTKPDLDCVVALNAFQELPDYYVPWLKSQT